MECTVRLRCAVKCAILIFVFIHSKAQDADVNTRTSILKGDGSDEKREIETLEIVEPLTEYPSEANVVSTKAENPQIKEGNRLYEEGMKLLERGVYRVAARKLAFQFLYEAAELDHVGAREQVAMATLLGWGMYQSLSRAFTDFELLAKTGNPRGQLGLGLMYAIGLKVNASVPHALVYLTFAALGGDDLAEMALAYRYWAGIGVEESCESALTYYRRVASKVAKVVSERSESGGPTLLGPTVTRARLLDEAELGIIGGVFGSSYSTAAASGAGLLVNEDLLQYYHFMADKNNVSAQVGLGQLYYQGRHGVEMNHERAVHFFKLAADGGSTLAMAFLGEIYMVGTETTPANPSLALQYLQRAAEAGNPIGQTGLGLVYLHGKAGIQPDPTRAMKYFLQAADQGWAEAQLHLGKLFLGTLGIKADFKLALKYFSLASQQGNTLAFYHLGELHASGAGVLRSCSTAAELFKNVAERGRWSRWLMDAHAAYHIGRFDEAFVTYQLLAELGYEVAQSNAAYILEEGKLTVVPKSELYNRSLVQWHRSATQGSTSSRVKLGDYYYYGLGTEPSYTAAIQHYRIASEMQRSSQAMFNLAYMHEQGLGFKRDIHLAKRFYDMAAEASSDAKIPVSLALIRLSFYFWLENLRQSVIYKFFARMFHAGNSSGDTGVEETVDTERTDTDIPVPSLSDNQNMDWDFYAIPLLAGLLLALLVFLHNRR